MTKSHRILLLVLALTAMNLETLRAADQPHMRRALEHLRAARAELQRAEHNKVGWRVKALTHVEQAIAATESGIKAAR